MTGNEIFHNETIGSELNPETLKVLKTHNR